MAGAFPQEVYDNVENALKAVFDKKKDLDAEKKFLAQNKGPAARKIDKCVKTFEEVGMADGFLEDLMAKHKVLKTAKDTSDAFQEILGRMIASNGIIGALGGCIKTIERQPLDENKVGKLKNALDEAIKNARVAVEQIGVISPEYEIDLDPLTEMEQKIAKLEGIAEEFEVEFKDLEDFWRDMADKLSRIQNGRENLNKMNDELIQAKNDYRKHAHVLTEKRQEAGEKLAQEITAEFAPLKLEKAQFRVQVEEKPEAPWTKLGFNEVTFLARMNPGQAFSPIAETASGGELARMILALKVVLQRVQTTSTLVFDEVDTGIGGAAAAAVGDRIAILSDKTQVIVITHSPQVASRGTHHYHISKRSDSETTVSKVTVLSMEERVHELSRMLAGGELTDESQAAAKRLIAEADSARASRQSAA
jgi:DNA repair protein RecN (Recombination protein N)